MSNLTKVLHDVELPSAAAPEPRSIRLNFTNVADTRRPSDLAPIREPLQFSHSTPANPLFRIA